MVACMDPRRFMPDGSALPGLIAMADTAIRTVGHAPMVLTRLEPVTPSAATCALGEHPPVPNVRLRATLPRPTAQIVPTLVTL